MFVGSPQRKIICLRVLTNAVFLLSLLILDGAQTRAQGITDHKGLGLYGDQAARAVPRWAKETIIYQIWLKSYGPNDAFKHVEARLDHIAKLGVNMVQLSPIHPHQGGSPYSIDDYFAINPDYGSEADFRHLISQTHQRGLKIIMDAVFVHTSHRNVLLTQHPDWYLRDQQGKLLLSQWKQPRLDVSKSQAREYLINSLIHWVKDFGVDGFRADVASGVARDFWDEARDALDAVKPNIFMLAEATSPELMLHAFDATYGVMHMWKLFKVLGYGAPALELQKQWKEDRSKFPRGTLMLRTLDNHDQRRAITEFGNRAAIAAMAINLTMDGIPFIYNGQEIGDPNLISINFFYPLFWEQERTVTATVEGIKVSRGGYAAQDLPIYTGLIKLRNKHTALTNGDLQWIANNHEESIVSYIRRKDDQEILVVVNLSNRPWKGVVDLSPEIYSFTNLITGEPVNSPLPNNLLTIELGPFDYLIAKRNSPPVAR